MSQYDPNGGASEPAGSPFARRVPTVWWRRGVAVDSEASRAGLGTSSGKHVLSGIGVEGIEGIEGIEADRKVDYMTNTTVAASEVDPFSREFIDDPWSRLRELRDLGAVVYLRTHNVWAVTRHAEVSAALRDHETFCSGAGVGLSDFRKETPWRPPSVILEADPPQHTKARKVLADVLSPANVKVMGEAFTKCADDLVEPLVDAGEFDGVSGLARLFPLTVFPDAVGVTPNDRHHLIAYGNMVFNSFGPRNEFFDQGMAGMTETREWIMAQCSRSALAPTGLGAQSYEAADRGEITHDEAGLLLRSFLSAGVDSTIAAIGAALWALASDPEQWTALRADPSLARAAFEEAIRWDGAIQTFFRTTTRPATIGQVTIPEGEKVLLLLAGANRDERRFENPDVYDLRRRTVGHVGYGFGIHVCVGQVVARMEGEAVLGAVARHAREIELVGRPTRRYNNSIRSFETLPLAFRS